MVRIILACLACVVVKPAKAQTGFNHPQQRERSNRVERPFFETQTGDGCFAPPGSSRTDTTPLPPGCAFVLNEPDGGKDAK